jgi:serine phosphatase RsbU (regulator of sigma subunit)
VGKGETFVSASIVLIALLGEWSALQARLVALDRDLIRTRADGRALLEQFAREHAIAAALQEALLPSVVPDIAGVVLSTAYRPAVTGLEIGGDWYDAFVLADGRLAVTIGDVAGHGLAASIVMGKMRQSLRLAAAMVPHPAAMLAAADGALRVEHPDTIVTAFVGLLEPSTGILQWASAGHPPAMIRRPDGRIDELTGQSPPLGLYDAAATSCATSLEPAAFFVAYTDGLIEFGRDVLGGLAKVRAAITRPELAERADAAAALFDMVVGELARDDVAVLTICMRESVETPHSNDRVLTST